RHIRALLLLLLTIVPWLAAVLLTVFGKQARGWLINHFGLPMLVRTVWSGLFIAAVLLMAMLVVAVLYRAGCPGLRSWNQVLPGAALATVLWWAVNSALGFFVARVPYTLAYGGLAAAIGLIIWMQLTAIVVFIGAAFNSLRASSASSAPLR
ncbi:MAG TPA: YhjD/YihY/BrkB family envelope integrity protein, partial [Candidatus Acidoferrales bacterium]|nr:YhjD/YihY/BrkB family envelope integrity protein [Candidatus Acidoferrales bacterium]